MRDWLVGWVADQSFNASVLIVSSSSGALLDKVPSRWMYGTTWPRNP